MNRLLLLRRVYSTFLLSMFCVLAFAQGKQITGVIKDGTGEPMIGVNVLVKGTTNGTITDFDGKFAISDVKNSDVLTITYVGYVQLVCCQGWNFQWCKWCNFGYYKGSED